MVQIARLAAALTLSLSCNGTFETPQRGVSVSISTRYVARVRFRAERRFPRPPAPPRAGHRRPRPPAPAPPHRGAERPTAGGGRERRQPRTDSRIRPEPAEHPLLKHRPHPFDLLLASELRMLARLIHALALQQHLPPP